jgi:hypothetical protein
MKPNVMQMDSTRLSNDVGRWNRHNEAATPILILFLLLADLVDQIPSQQ